MRLAACLGLVALSLVAGCVSPYGVEGFKNPEYGGLKRAAFEMQCSESQLEIVALDGGGTVGATGCGKRAVYKWVYGAGWVNNTGGEDPKGEKPAK